MSGFDFTLFVRGGPVMWVVGALALVGLMLFIERTLYLHRGQIRAKAFLDGIKNALAKRRLVEALTLCEEAPGPVAAVVKAALLQAAVVHVEVLNLAFGTAPLSFEQWLACAAMGSVVLWYSELRKWVGRTIAR